MEKAPRTALITGVAGQDGIYLARLLRAEGMRVVGTVRPGSDSSHRMAPYLTEVAVLEHDIRDGDAFREILAAQRPDEVYNLAALTSVGASWKDPDLAAAVNGQAVEGVLTALLSYRDESRSDVRFFQASSAESFASASSSPYALAKSLAHEVTGEYRATFGLRASCGILHNHESPLRGRQFVTRKITYAAAEIACGVRESVSLGNLDIRRDWGAAREYVTAMPLMLRREEPADFVIGTGVAHSLEDLLVAAFDAAGLADPWQYVERDPSLMRPVDAETLVADTGHTVAVLGWHATSRFEEVVAEMTRVDLQRVRCGVAESAAYLDR